MASKMKIWNPVCSRWEWICVHETEEECGGTEYTCEDFIQSNTSSYVTVCTNDSATENGEALIAAYTAAKALTPNGAALSATNRACVIVPPGKYNLDHLDAPAPAGITITPDAVGSNPVTWYYRLSYIDAAAPTYRSILTEESSFTIGDSTTEIIMSGYNIPSWALEGINIILGTTSGLYNYAGGSGNPSPIDLFGNYTDMGIGNLYPLLLLVPIHQDCTPLTLDTEFVDIIGLTSDRSLQHIYGTPVSTNSGVIIQTANDVHISNLTVEILTAWGTPNEDSTDSAAYFPSTNLNSTVVDNVYFKGGDGNDTVLYAMRLAIEYSGIYTNCTGGVGIFGLKGVASGTFTNCTGGMGAFSPSGIASGTFTNCIGVQSSFGEEGIPSGTFSFCRVTADTFPTPVASVATITLVAGGTGYTANDELTVVGGTGTAATIKVLTVNAGVILTAEILTVGSYTVEPENAVAVTGGTGNNDATFNLTWHEGHVYGCIDNTGFITELNWDD